MLLGNILVVGLVTLHQKRLDDMLANSSVMHMGYLFLGLAAGTEIAVKGSILLMFAHGISIALLFAICGRMRNQLGTLEMAKLGGIGGHAPFLTVVFAFGAFASIGLPGLANFAGEVMIFMGAFANGNSSSTLIPAQGLTALHWTVILALWGVVISAVYMLRGYRAIFQGTPQTGLFMSDPVSGQWLPLVLLAAVLLAVGWCDKTAISDWKNCLLVGTDSKSALSATKRLNKPLRSLLRKWSRIWEISDSNSMPLY
jgi:NADH-quinone oxidoreductase subunit M